MLLWLRQRLLLMLCHIYLTVKLSDSSCEKELSIWGALDESIDLVCNMPTTCSRGIWRRTNAWLVPHLCNDCGDSFKVFNNLSLGINILRINNVSGNHVGLYNCECEYLGYRTNRTERDTLLCYNVTTYPRTDCQMKIRVNGDISTISGSFQEDTKETIAVHIDDNVTFDCHDEAKRRNDCPHTDAEGVVGFNQYSRKCKISCVSSKNDMTCRIKVILDISPLGTIIERQTTSNTHRSLSLPTSNHIDARTISSLDSLSSSKSGGRPPSTILLFSINSEHLYESSLTTSKSTPSRTTVAMPFLHKDTTSTDFTSKSIPRASERGTGFVSPSVFSSVHSPSIRFTQSSASQKLEETPNNISDASSPKVTSVIITSCAIFFATIIGVLICLHVMICKIGIQKYSDKEETLTSVLESERNGVNLQRVSPMAFNLNKDIEGSLQVKLPLSSDSNENLDRRSQMRSINRDELLRDEISGNDERIDTLGHGVTSFSNDLINSG